MQKFYNVIVIGGGHAGCEAAHAAARILNSNQAGRVLLITMDETKIGAMSCNPAIGGLAKGQLVKEIDALGGVMGRITDRSAIQYRRLNESKGPAVRSSRAQCDKYVYALEMQKYLKTVEGLDILEDEVQGVLDRTNDPEKFHRIVLKKHGIVHGKCVIITSGTFMRGLMYTGFTAKEGGRVGDQASMGLSGSLEQLGFQLRRLKTGTPPRIHRNSINYTNLIEQKGDAKPYPFSFYHQPKQFPLLPQVSCFITFTNEQTHEIIENNFDQSPMFKGLITGVGPRYCPSIEDKVKRFRDKERHQLFIEPEGLNTDEMYINGISTSLPADIQDKFVRTIPGLEQAEFLRYGYAVEYDSVDSKVLMRTLESKDIPGLFFAGQVNGTSGYEEAGAQGIIAGINAAQKVLNREPFILERSDAYIGVMIDDLILKGSDEPYRMFTSRAEFRLVLREDNADARLSEKSYKLGLLSAEDFKKFEFKQSAIENLSQKLHSNFLYPANSGTQWLVEKGITELKDRVSFAQLARRPEISVGDIVSNNFEIFESNRVDDDVIEANDIRIKYEGYIKRDLELLDTVKKADSWAIPKHLDFNEIPGLSAEIKGRLSNYRPETIGQITRMMGVTPAAVANVVIHLKMLKQKNNPPEALKA